jgi:HD-GYP domain-containing protein (c-di-GMP phosphodiesterase class II)
MNTPSTAHIFGLLEQLNTIGKALSAEKDIDRLLEGILLAAKRITHADAGTLYRVHDMQTLTFEIMRTDSLGFALGGTTGKPITLPPIPLYDAAGKPNNTAVVAYAVLNDQTVNIADAYTAEGFDFSGTRFFDEKNGYRSQSFLTVPMKNHENEIIGVLQLINAQDASSGRILPFSEEQQRLVESLASQAAIALTNRQLINQLEELFESFIKLINIAIDEKSPYTGGHCERVPVLTLMLAEAATNTTQGALKDFSMTPRELYELKIAGLLHDCGKVTTPVHVVDKSTKLETLFDRIHLVDTRFEVLKRDAEIAWLRARLAALESGDVASAGALEKSYREYLRQLDEDRDFLHKCNHGGEFMSDALQQRVRDIGARRWTNEEGEDAPFLSDEEIECLNIAKGTLTAAEREIINHHIVATIKMLEALPWPKHLRRVPELAGGHHERMDGKGYPRGLTREQMSLPARMMGIADIFEALTAKDRPYKVGKTLTEALTILGRMKLDHHVDPDLFDLFIREKVYLRYAREFLEVAQIDEVDESRIPGYVP